MNQIAAGNLTRPVEVAYIERASFADLHDIGLPVLAKRDVTVINELDMPGYAALIKIVQTEFKGLDLKNAGPAKLALSTHPTIRLLDHQYSLLGRSERNLSHLAVETGKSQSDQKFSASTGAPHIDAAVSREFGSITLNATFFSEGEWLWGVSGETTLSNEETRNIKPELLVPLSAPGVVILGDEARNDFNGDHCTVVHEVISPEESWNTDTVQRVRGLLYSRAD